MGKILNVMIYISFCLAASFVFPPFISSNQMVDNSGCLECHDTTSGGEEDIHTIHSSSVCRQCHNGPNQAGNVSASSCIICHPLDDDKEQCQLVIYHELSTGYNPSGESCASCHSNCMGGITTTIPPTTTTTVEVVIENHMMTKDPGKNTDCQIPVPETTFYSHDEAAYCWFSWDYASEEDEIIFRCYKPDGELYKEKTTLAEHKSGCWFPGIYISGHDPSEIPGTWSADVYFEGVKKFTEYFTIVIPTTTTTVPTTTTSSSSSTTVPTTTTTTEPGGCSAEQIYGEYSEEAVLLRNFRDNVLSKSSAGQELIKLYYKWSPVIAVTIENDEEFKEEVKDMIDGVLPLIKTAAE